MTKENVIHTNQGSFHYHILGKSEDQVYFCHGNSLSAGTYRPFLEMLCSNDIQIYANDIRGHGLSTQKNTSHIKNWDIFIRDLEQVVSTLVKPPVIGMGHSIGGYFIYAAAALYPHLFSRVILLDPVIFPLNIIWFAALLRKTGQAGKLPLPRMTRKKKFEFLSRQEAVIHYSKKGMFQSWRPEYVQAYVETAIKKNKAAKYELCCRPEFEAQIYEFVPFNTWQHAKKIKVPVMVIRAEKSDLFYRKAGIRLAKTIKDCTFIELKNLGHFLMMEDPDRIIGAVLPFIQSSTSV